MPKLHPKILPSSNFYIFLRHVGVVLRKIEGKVELGSYLLYFLYLKTLKTSQNNFYMGNSFHVSLQNNDKRQKKTGRLFCYTSKLNKVTRKSILTSNEKVNYYRTRVRSLVILVSDSLTHWLLFSKLDWCDRGVWRCQLKTCWSCFCCRCLCWGSCWQQFVADLGTKVWS